MQILFHNSEEGGSCGVVSRKLPKYWGLRCIGHEAACLLLASLLEIQHQHKEQEPTRGPNGQAMLKICLLAVTNYGDLP